MTGSDTTFPYGKTEKDFLIVACVKDFLIVACIIAAKTSATIIRKFWDQGSKFRHETEALLPSFVTIKEVHLLNVPSLIYGKTEKDFLIVACVKAAETRLLSQGKIKTLGLIFRHETRIFARLLPSYATIQEVFRSLTIVFELSLYISFYIFLF